MNTQVHGKSKCSLAEEVLKSWGRLQLRAQGTSMLPSIWPGDLLTIQSHSPERAARGDIVLYLREGRFFIHRVVSKSSSGSEVFLFTRGDCMAQDDPPVHKTELLGVVTEIRRSGLLLAPTQKLSPFRLVFAWVLCHWALYQRMMLRFFARRHSHQKLRTLAC
jgi:signal peptidase I